MHASVVEKNVDFADRPRRTNAELIQNNYANVVNTVLSYSVIETL